MERDARDRIAFLLPDMSGGGAERVALTLAHGFAARGHSVDIVLQRRSGELLALINPEIEIVDLGAPRVRQAPSAFARYLKSRKPAAVVAFMWPLTVAAVIGRMLSRHDCRLILTDHAMLSCQYPSRATRASLRLSTSIFYPRADSIVQVSHGAADDLASLSGIPRASIFVINNPIDLPTLPLERSARVESSWNRGSRRILTVGSIKPEKRHSDLLKAIAILREEGVDVQLAIVGDGPLRMALEKEIGSLDLEGHVHLAGFESNPWPWYAAADLFVLSSDQEGYGNVLVEALHAGLPIVSTDCPGGPAEILDHGLYGRLVPVGQPVELAGGIKDMLQSQTDKDAQKRRAADLAGNAPLDRYEALASLGQAA